MRHVGRAVEELVDAVAAVGFDDGAAAGFGVFLNDATGVAEEHAWLDEFDGFGEALARGFNDADRVAGGEGGGADVVGFVEVAVEAAMVECDVEVEDVAVEEDALVWNAMTDYFVGGGADGFGEVNVVQGGRVGLWLGLVVGPSIPCEVLVSIAVLTFRSMHALCTTSSR